MWEGWSGLAVYVAPVAFLAADLGHRSQGPRQIAMTAAIGVTLPIFGSLLLVAMIQTATFASDFYQPSLNPSIAMALWSKAAGSALPGRMLIATVTLFGAIRFGAKALADTVSIHASRTRWLWLGCFVVAITWCSLHPFAQAFTTAFDFSARSLGVTSAILTADFLIGRRRMEPVRVDWVGCLAGVAGLALPQYAPYVAPQFGFDPGRYPWLLPCYLLAFLLCLCGRAVQKIGYFSRSR
jgi:hypothetical protein